MRSTGGRRGRVPAWIPLGIVLVGVLSLVARLEDEAAARGVAKIDLTRYALHTEDRWVSPAWTVRLERTLLGARSLPAEDQEGIDALVEEVAALSFVAEVGAPEVEWPDGLVLPVRLHQPVACLKIDDDFLPVAADGTVLAGYGYAPHRAFGGHLPVLGPHGLDADPDWPFEPGDILAHPVHLAGLSVAVSLWQHLDRDERGRIGRIVIDAGRDQAWDGKPGGVVLDLEGARRIHFGRPPQDDIPGELPVATKWAHVAEALERWENGGEFAAVDVRWDQPDWLHSPGGER